MPLPKRQKIRIASPNSGREVSTVHPRDPEFTSDIRPLWAALVIVLAGLVSYHNSFSVPFVFDDHLSITENPTLSSLATAWIPPRGQGATVEGRPLLNVSLALSRALWPVNTVAFHAMNLAIHLGAGLALLGLVRRTLQAPCFAPTVRSNATVLAGFIALLWTVHPLQTESVTYIVQRAESQMGLFFLLTLYAFVRGCEGGAAAGIWFSGAIVACWLGAATKEVMVAAPILAWLHDRTFTAGSFRAAWQKRRAVYVGLFTAWILVGLLVWSSGSRGGTVGFGAQVGWWDYALTQCDAITRYLRLAVWPNPLVFDYGVEANGSLGDVAPQALLVAGLLVGTAWALVKRPLWGFLGIWFLAMLAPTSLIPGNRQTIAEHRIYLSLAAVLGIGVVGTHVLLTWWNRVWAATLGVLLGTGVTLGLMALTVDRNGDYRSELALYRDTAAKRPGNAFAHYNLGNYLAEHGQPLAAITAYEAALQARPDFPAALFNLGNAQLALGRISPAEDAFRSALRLQPNYANAHYNLGNVLVQSGRKAEAATHFATAVQLVPEFHAAHENLGFVLLELGRNDEARSAFETILLKRPESAAAHFGLGNVWFLAGRMAEATAEYERALGIAPDLAAARRQLELARAGPVPRF